MAYIGLISDTHCYFDDKLRDFLSPVDVIWHAGDFGNLETANQIAEFKSLIGVSGNCDGYDTRVIYPLVQCFEVEGMKVLMTHIGGYPGKYDARAFLQITKYSPNIFVCGHSHILKIINDTTYNMMTLNPGAAGISGFHQVRTALRFRIENGKMKDMEVGEWNRFINNSDN